MSEAKVTDRQGRVLFRGTREDAEKFVQDNFPRVHVEPGVDYGDNGPAPDVEVTGGDEDAEAELPQDEPETVSDDSSEPEVTDTFPDPPFIAPRRRKGRVTDEDS